MCRTPTRIQMSNYSTSKKINALRRKLAKLGREYNDVMEALGITITRAPCGNMTTLQTLKHEIRALEHEIALGNFRLACA